VLVLICAPQTGSGKTALWSSLARSGGRPRGVIVVTLATDNDAIRLRAAAARPVQIQTVISSSGGGDGLGRAFDQLEPQGMELLRLRERRQSVCPPPL